MQVFKDAWVLAFFPALLPSLSSSLSFLLSFLLPQSLHPRSRRCHSAVLLAGFDGNAAAHRCSVAEATNDRLFSRYITILFYITKLTSRLRCLPSLQQAAAAVVVVVVVW